MSGDRGHCAAPRPWQRWVVVGISVLAVVHSALLMLWLSPSSPLRSSIGSTTLASYVNPYFRQSNDILGVGAQYVDESFRVRAYVRVDGQKKLRLTKWIDITRADNTASRGEVDPTRVHLIARRLAANLNLAMFGLTPAQRSLVQEIGANDLPSEVTIALEKAGGDPLATRTFQAYDQMATQFSSLYARSAFSGEGVVAQVQFQVGRRTVPPRLDRATTTLRDVPLVDFGFGWRTAFRGSAEARAQFDSYVKKQ